MKYFGWVAYHGDCRHCVDLYAWLPRFEQVELFPGVDRPLDSCLVDRESSVSAPRRDEDLCVLQ